MTRATRPRAGVLRDVLSTADRPPAPAFDVSIILNLHDEARYLRRTMRSLEEAVLYARRFDITFEIVVVLDNADGATAALAEGWDYSVFDGHQVIRVRNGSLGLSRNDGVAVSRGEYVTMADGDDLVSFDFLQRMYMTALGSSPCVVLPEYSCGFGARNFVRRLYPDEYTGFSALFGDHPYLSRIMLKRAVFDRIAYRETPSASGYAYEDWHLNCECAALGIGFRVATGAVLFYRQRQDSLMRRGEGASTRLIPGSRYFEPATFLKRAWAEMTGSRSPRSPARSFGISEFLDAPDIPEVFEAANRIDPMIGLGTARYGDFGTNLPHNLSAARLYFEVCRKVAGSGFTDVLIVPFMAKGGAEKYILSIIDALAAQQAVRLLVISTQRSERHEWLDRLPAGSLFLDLWALGERHQPADIELVVLRLLQHLPGLKRLHLKNCEFVDAFARRYMRYLPQLDTTFYHFCDPRVVVGGIPFVNGQCFDLVSEAGPRLTRIISDHRRELDFVAEAIGEDVPARSHAVYASCELPAIPLATRTDPARRLLWASRIDSQKRPHLVGMIARRLQQELPDVTVDAYGGTTYGAFGPEVFRGVQNLAYRGGFGLFEETSPHDYDAFLYTAAFDGLPNVILEAMAAGLPVIAADVGGIAEAVSGDTGYLIDDDVDEDALVERYVEAIRALYDDFPDALRRGRNGRRLVEERHSREAHRARVCEVFGLGTAAQRPHAALVSA